jgi:hypothetical protein
VCFCGPLISAPVVWGLGGFGLVEQRNGPSYHFVVGSVESFERNLEQAQVDLGIDASEFIPVTYVNETNIGSVRVRVRVWLWWPAPSY